MRPLLVGIIAVTVLGGLQWFLADHQPEKRTPVLLMVPATGEYSVEVASTFDIGPDEFGLDAPGETPSLIVRLNGEELLRKTDSISAAAGPMFIRPVDGIVVGTNEFFIEASPQQVGSLAPRALRVRVMRDDIELVKAFLWSDFGGTVQGALRLEVKE